MSTTPVPACFHGLPALPISFAENRKQSAIWDLIHGNRHFVADDLPGHSLQTGEPPDGVKLWVVIASGVLLTH